MTISEYMEYEAEIKKKDPNDVNLFAPNSHYEDEEVSSDEDVDEWLNVEMSKHMTGQDKEEDKDALIDILKIVVEECKSIYKKAKIKAPSGRTSKIQGISFVTKKKEEDSSETLPCQLPPKEIIPESFTLPCIMCNLKLYAMANLGARLNKTMLLGRPFLAIIHAQIDVFRREISLGIGKEKVKFDMNGGICHSRVPVEKIYMESSVQEGKNFSAHEIENDVFSYDSPACLLLEQGTLSCSEESIDTVDSSHDMQELEGSQDDEVGSHLLENIVSRWHVFKPVRITFVDCEKDYGHWPTCNPNLSFYSGYDAIYGQEENGMFKQWICFRDHERQNVEGNGMIFADFLKVRYGNKNIDDVTRERRYYKWVARNYNFNVKSRRATKYADYTTFSMNTPTHTFLRKYKGGLDLVNPDIRLTMLNLRLARIMDPASSLGRIYLRENVYGSPSKKVKGHGDWDALAYTDTASSSLDAYNGEIDLALDENLISNEFAMKLCLDYEVKKGNNVVKKNLIVALREELYFVKFIINLKEDDMELEVILGRSFMRLVNGIVDFGSGVITVYPEQDPFEDDSGKSEKSIDDWDQLLDFNFDDIPQLDGEELPLFVCKIRKSSRNKKRAMENLNLFYPDIEPSLSTGRHLTQEEAANEALELIISQRFALLVEIRLVLETMAYNDQYKKVFDEIWKDRVELDGMITEEEEKTIIKVKCEALKEEDDPEAFIFPIRFEGKINENALADTGSDINTMPYRIYEKLEREEIKRYAGVFKNMAGVYSVSQQGAYNPPGYAQPQYDQYYKQYPPQPPSYQQHQQDDE
nr:hypothetical protein [Tanacetum cinerariifolium]